MKYYGNLTNRFEEGKNYSKDNLIHVGDDITMYYWSDRTCYYVTDVISQKEIKVKRYHVCADHSKAGGQGHQNWLYFKTVKERNKYLNSVIEGGGFDENPLEDEEETWVYRYNKWMIKYNWNNEILKEAVERCKSDLNPNTPPKTVREYVKYRTELNDKELDNIENNKVVYKYRDLSGKVSFGIKDYYYDWEF